MLRYTRMMILRVMLRYEIMIIKGDGQVHS